MNTVHIVMAAAAALLAVVALVAVRGRREQRLVTLLACVALVIGHLASMLPAAPEWYASAVIFASVAGFGAVVWIISAALTAGRLGQREAAAPQPRTRPALSMVEATVVEDPTPGAEVVSIMRERPVRHVTRQQILAAGPTGAERTTGSTYVAAKLVDYVDAGKGSSMARAHRRTAAHAGPVVASRTVSPEQRLRTLQLRAAYAQHGPRPAAHDLRA